MTREKKISAIDFACKRRNKKNRTKQKKYRKE